MALPGGGGGPQTAGSGLASAANCHLAVLALTSGAATALWPRQKEQAMTPFTMERGQHGLARVLLITLAAIVALALATAVFGMQPQPDPAFDSITPDPAGLYLPF